MPSDDDVSRKEVEDANEAIFANAQNVAHADVVTNAVKTEIATVVSHAENVGTVEVHGEPIRSDRTRKLSYIREIARSVVTFFALLVMVVVIVDKNANEDTLREQLDEFQDERTASDVLTASKLECTRRYQDLIDQYTEEQLILIGEFLVVITQSIPGPARDAEIEDKINRLDRANIAARESVIAKIDYNNQGNPLPCPLEQSTDPPLPPEPDASTETTIPITPTT